ncbi:hypothetical protein ACTA71_012327, partial [Dictyostelium dimigraforme]
RTTATTTITTLIQAVTHKMKKIV